MAIWRHSLYWYIGDFGEWPPATFYRCIVGCDEGLEEPPLNGYKAKRGMEGDKIYLQTKPCDGAKEDQEL